MRRRSASLLFVGTYLIVALVALVNGCDPAGSDAAPATLAAPAPLPSPARIAELASRRADPYTLDLARDGGALPGPEHASRNRRALQNLIDALDRSHMPDRGNGLITGKITVPNRTYWIDGPVWWDQSRTMIVGAGPNSGIRLVHNREDAILILGAARRPEGRGVEPADFPPNPLDPSRRAVRTGRKHHLAQMAGPLAFGPDRWSKLQELSVELALDTTDRALSSGPIIAAQEGNDPAPLVLRAEASGFITALWKLAGAPASGPAVSGFQFRAPADRRGVLRVTVQVDLATRSARGYVDGLEAAESWEVWRTTAAPGLDRFAPHQHAPALVGAAGDKALSHGSSPAGADPDHEITLLGLHLSMGLRAPDRPPSAYFAADADTIALLPLDEPAESMAFWRAVPVLAGPALGGRRSSALIFDPAHGSPFSTITAYELRGLTLGPAGGFEDLGTPHGQTIALGHVTFSTIADCHILGGAHALGMLGSSAAYRLAVEDCTLAGTDAAVFGWYCQLRASGLHVPYSGRAGFFRNHLGKCTFTDVFVGPYGEPETLGRTSGGGTTRLVDVNIDREAGDWPTLAAFWHQSSLAPTVGALDLERVAIGHVPPGVPLVRLVDESPGSPEVPALRIDRLEHENGERPRVDQVAPRWRIRDRDLDEPGGPPVD